MSKSRYEKSIDARDEAVYRFVKFMTNKSAADADLDGVKCNRLLDELALAHINMCFEQEPDGTYCRRAPPRQQWGRSCPYKEQTMTRPKIGWVDPLALPEDYKKTLRDGAKKVPAE